MLAGGLSAGRAAPFSDGYWREELRSRVRERESLASGNVCLDVSHAPAAAGRQEHPSSHNYRRLMESLCIKWSHVDAGLETPPLTASLHYHHRHRHHHHHRRRHLIGGGGRLMTNCARPAGQTGDWLLLNAVVDRYLSRATHLSLINTKQWSPIDWRCPLQLWRRYNAISAAAQSCWTDTSEYCRGNRDRATHLNRLVDWTTVFATTW